MVLTLGRFLLLVLCCNCGAGFCCLGRGIGRVAGLWGVAAGGGTSFGLYISASSSLSISNLFRVGTFGITFGFCESVEWAGRVKVVFACGGESVAAGAWLPCGIDEEGEGS